MFTSVVKVTTIYLVLSMVVVENVLLHQMDVKMTFIHGNFEMSII